MKKLHLCLLFSLGLLTASAQKVYFIYIQTEGGQPFFVRMNEKVSSSSASGYIIMPKLVDSTYKFVIGFPQNKFPEQSFSVKIDHKDHGYLLKSFGEKGWGLYDLQTMSIQMGSSGKPNTGIDIPAIAPGEVSAFTEILAKAAGDPSLREKPVRIKEEPVAKKEEVVVKPKKEEPKKQQEVKEELTVAKTGTENSKPAEPVQAAVVKQEEKPLGNDAAGSTTAIATDQPGADVQPAVEKSQSPRVTAEIKTVAMADTITGKKETAAEEMPVVKTEEVVAQTATGDKYNPSQVNKWAESSTTEGLGLVFIDKYENGNRDTIRLVIPNPKPAVVIAKEEPVEEKVFISVSELPKTEATPAVKKTGQPVADKVVATKEEPVIEKAVVKNSCRDVATGDDFVILRKKMAAATDDDAMIAEAKKYYKSKCFTTRQIKLLGTLFLTDEGRYNYFDASYKYVSDIQSFQTLQDELKDEYYATRFKAMLRN